MTNRSSRVPPMAAPSPAATEGPEAQIPGFYRVREDMLQAALNLLGNNVAGIPYVQLHQVIEALRASEPIKE